jgi:hypothetical protein
VAVWLEKLTGELAGNLSFPNFGFRCMEIGVAAREKDFRSRISASRRRPAYI